MKKIPTLFKINYDDNKKGEITREVTPGMEFVFEGRGVATRKSDGSACMVLDNQIYARYDAKHGRKAPAGAIPCQPEADAKTGHFPHWVLVKNQQQYTHHRQAFARYNNELPNGTYEICGEHFQRNVDAYTTKGDVLIRHGSEVLEVERSYEGIRAFLEAHQIEGIVFWLDGEPRCKIRRRDFGFDWN